jgi:hypothetical protein
MKTNLFIMAAMFMALMFISVDVKLNLPMIRAVLKSAGKGK